VNSLVFETASGCLERVWLLSQDRHRRIARGRIVIHNVNESSCVLHGISFAQLPLTASSNSSNTGIAASLEDMQLTRHVALTPNQRLAPIRAEAISALLASAESCAETARVASIIGRQVLRRYSFDSDWPLRDVEGEELGIGVFDSAGNFRHPACCHARHFGLLAGNPFGLGAQP
jgi:hypothetical protein